MRRVKLFAILRMSLELIENVYISMDGGGPEIVVTGDVGLGLCYGTSLGNASTWQEDEEMDDWLADLNNTLADRFLPVGEAWAGSLS